jgi:cellulose synthase/poly-beta-1,6-N-acetylglucosamine synthase-like glycosyltransferase
VSAASKVQRAPLLVVDLRPFRRSDGRWVDPVDRRAVALVPEGPARELGVVVYADTPKAIYAAAVWPPSPRAVAVLEGLGKPVRLGRIDERALAEVHDRVWPRPGRARIGEILARSGKVTPRELAEALRLQHAQGGKLGRHLLADNFVTHWDVAEAVARQAGLPLVDLITGRGVRLVPELFALMDETFWRDHLCVPLSARPGVLTLAMVDPGDEEAVAEVERRTGLRVRRAVTGYRDVLSALENQYRSRRLTSSVEWLRRERPDDSAAVTLSREQRLFALVVAVVFALSLARFPITTLAVFAGMCQVLYLAIILFRFALMRRAAGGMIEVFVSPEEVAALDEATLPPYTVLVPAYREASVLPILTRALSEIDYPKDRLEVKLLLEADDEETIAAARQSHLPNYIDIVVVPPSEPRTKPKACNYGLLQSRGEYVVIFDAEDAPEPDQLKKVIAAFRQVPEDIACIQAKLSYFNAEQNILTRWFTAEYAMWFDVLLPALTTHRMPIPLGGTSNHFRADVLRRVGMWDPHNVAEDADLGIRLHKLGFRTAVVDSTTYEEANSEFVNWVRQRSRWTKGYMQTWLVHMRHPLLLWRELGTKAFIGFQLMVGGNPATQLINPLLWAVTTLWFLTYWVPIQHFFPAPVYYVSMVDLTVGNFFFTYINLVGLVRRRAFTLVRANLFAPVYWAMMSVAAWKALMQMVLRPSFWEKTDHGLTTFLPESFDVGGQA